MSPFPREMIWLKLQLNQSCVSLKKTYAMVLEKLDQQELKISGSIGIKDF